MNALAAATPKQLEILHAYVHTGSIKAAAGQTEQKFDYAGAHRQGTIHPMDNGCSEPQTWTFPFMHNEHCVYIAKAGDRVVYVGMSSDFPARLSAHQRRAPWSAIADRVEFHTHPTRSLASTCERRNIHRFRPPYQTGVPPWEPAAPKPERQWWVGFERPLVPIELVARRVRGDYRSTDVGALRLQQLLVACREWGWPAL